MACLNLFKGFIVEDVVYHAPGEAWASGCVMARMKIDADTGQPKIERMVWVDDAGRIISPQLAEGQLIGGMAQGIGQALLERIVYDDEGQLLTGSLMDYAVPRAGGVPAARYNAAADALAPPHLAERELNAALEFPLTAARLWLALRSAK